MLKVWLLRYVNFIMKFNIPFPCTISTLKYLIILCNLLYNIKAICPNFDINENKKKPRKVMYF